MADTSGTRRERRAAARAERQERERAEAARVRQRKRLFQLGGAVALAAAIIVVIVIATSSGGGNSGPTRRAGESVAGAQDTAALFRGIQQSGITLGDPRAPVTMVEFADLQCPYCKEFTLNTLPQVVDQYVRDGRVKIVFRNLAFIGTDSTRAAQMAEAVGMQNRMWDFVDLFYKHQGTENSGFVTDAFLREIAGGVRGVDVNRAMDARGDAAVDRALREAQTAATDAGFTGTPSFLVGPTGGTMEPVELQTGFPLSDFTRPIDRALAQR